MELRIICVGKLNDNESKIFCNKYLNKIQKFIKTSIVEINEITFRQENHDTIKKSLKNEANLLHKYLDNSFNVCLSIKGRQLDSINFSKKIEEWILNSSYKYINFIIGSSHGLDQEIENKCHFCLSFSQLTFPHQLIRVFLLEQIYRAFKINNNETYHK